MNQKGTNNYPDERRLEANGNKPNSIYNRNGVKLFLHGVGDFSFDCTGSSTFKNGLNGDIGELYFWKQVDPKSVDRYEAE